MSGKGGDGVTETTETPPAGPTGVPGNGKGVPGNGYGIPGNGNGKGVGADTTIPEEPGKALGHTKSEQ